MQHDISLAKRVSVLKEYLLNYFLLILGTPPPTSPFFSISTAELRELSLWGPSKVAEIILPALEGRLGGLLLHTAGMGGRARRKPACVRPREKQEDESNGGGGGG